jgi:hypothetical protein
MNRNRAQRNYANRRSCIENGLPPCDRGGGLPDRGLSEMAWPVFVSDCLLRPEELSLNPLQSVKSHPQRQSHAVLEKRVRCSH